MVPKVYGFGQDGRNWLGLTKEENEVWMNTIIHERLAADPNLKQARFEMWKEEMQGGAP